MEPALFFNFGDLFTERGLTDMQYLCGTREVQFFGQNYYRVQMTQFEDRKHGRIPTALISVKVSWPIQSTFSQVAFFFLVYGDSNANEHSASTVLPRLFDTPTVAGSRRVFAEVYRVRRKFRPL